MLPFCWNSTDSPHCFGEAFLHNCTHKETLIAQSRIISWIMNNTQQSTCDRDNQRLRKHTVTVQQMEIRTCSARCVSLQRTPVFGGAISWWKQVLVTATCVLQKPFSECDHPGTKDRALRWQTLFDNARHVGGYDSFTGHRLRRKVSRYHLEQPHRLLDKSSLSWLLGLVLLLNCRAKNFRYSSWHFSRDCFLLH